MSETALSQLRQRMLSQSDRLMGALTSSLSPERAIHIACNSIAKNPELLKCSPGSIFGAINEAGTYGLVIDGIAGESYLVPFKQRATLMIGYKGWLKLIEQGGKCVPFMDVVHEGDTYEYRGKWERPVHIESQHEDRRERPVTHVYVIAEFDRKQMPLICRSWTAKECEAHRDRYSQGWKRSKGEAKKNHPWNPATPTSFGVMGMKSLLLYMIQRREIPCSADVGKLIDRTEIVSGEVVADPEQVSVPNIPTLDLPSEPQPHTDGPQDAEAPSNEDLDGMEAEATDGQLFDTHEQA